MLLLVDDLVVMVRPTLGAWSVGAPDLLGKPVFQTVRLVVTHRPFVTVDCLVDLFADRRAFVRGRRTVTSGTRHKKYNLKLHDQHAHFTDSLK